MNSAEFLNQFAQPDPRFSPVPAWWWSGEKLEIGRMRWQMDQLKSMGIHNIVVINLAPSGTLFGSDPDDPPYQSQEWWSIFEQVCDHAKSIGTFLWFYDQIGFSGASFQADITISHPEFFAQQLHRIWVEGTGDLVLESPQGATSLAAYVFPLDQPTQIHYLPTQAQGVSVQVDVPSRLCLVCTLQQGYDFFSTPACAKLLSTVHGEFQRRLPQHLGTTIVGSYQDELPDLPTWGVTFDQTFFKKYGYHLIDVIHRLFEAGDAESRRTRVHYHQHRADLAEAAFFKPFYNWHQQHSLQCGFDQQSPAREARVMSSVAKYADYIQTHRWYAIPGSDLHGNGKLHASIAFMYSRPRVWLEGFHSTGWGGTIADTFDWLLPYLQSGANLYNPHAVYYSTKNGWWEWAPPSTCWRQPYARHYRPFADMISRLTKLLSVGIQQASVAVLFPSATVQSALGPQEHFPDAEASDLALHEVIGSMRWHQVKTGPLNELAIDFHLLDESTIASSQLIGDSMIFRDVPFRIVILPHVTFLRDQTVDRLRAFAEAGGRIVAVGSETIETPGGTQLRVSSLSNARFIPSAGELKTVLTDVPRPIGAPVPTLYRKEGDIHVLFVPAAAGMATEVKWAHWFAPLEHTTIVPERYRKSADLLLPQSAKVVWRFDPWTGKSQPLQAEDGHLALAFEGAPFAVLAWNDSEDAPFPVTSTQPDTQYVALADTWESEYVPTLPEDYADVFDPAHPEMRWPRTTDFKWLQGHADADFSVGIPASLPTEMVRAGFGVRAWRTDPSNTDRKPINYSPQFGVLQDPIHTNTIGPKGRVPEEFIDLGKLTNGQMVTIHTGVVCDSDRELILAIGANATKGAAVNETPLPAAGTEYLWLTPARFKRGENSIDLILTAHRDGTVRLFWCLLDPAHVEGFIRPERIVPAGPAIPGSKVIFRRLFELAHPTEAGALKISVGAMANLFIDDVFLGRQGGFDPYRPMLRGQTHTTPPLGTGRHDLRIELLEPKPGVPLLVDLRAPSPGNDDFLLISDKNWTVIRNTEPAQPVRIHDRQEADAAAWQLYRRAHPLAQAEFANQNNSPKVVLDLPLIPPTPQPEAQWFQWIVPPGAVSMRLSIDGDAQLWIDGKNEPIKAECEIQLPSADARPARTAVLRVTSRQLSGGVFHKPITYEFARGRFRSGSWLKQGLRSYSGAVRLHQTFSHSVTGQNPIALDLGNVRGTVAARLNGHEIGIRCMAPYRFEVTDFVKDGANELELVVTNTLANHLSTWSPTRWWSPDQLDAGVFGQ